MLILTRRKGEALVMRTDRGELIHATVLGTHGNQVRIGIDAPASVQVDREEIYLKKQAEFDA